MAPSSTPAPDADLESYWTAVANIIRERPYGSGGADIRRGTKHFAPGAKVYIIDWYAGMCERIIVVGLHRKSKKYIRLVIDVKLVENVRPKLCYTPAVIKKIKEYYTPSRREWLTQEFAERICKTIPYWQQELKKGAGAFKDPPAAYADPKFSKKHSFLSRLWIDINFLLKS
ncbi:hypothetical protein IC235_13765 [Hymenobacter sp. BT664]|uniref:Uncharacterized protein n=1 Tax=Hymenobacter montanus TaxID=2771359 RepID=A0A927GKA2_9BACT|nr:hypothetical protein [Hymenobacter montanus]MBD2768954.1 hypothetical protein [Hymenobacter montanus]